MLENYHTHTPRCHHATGTEEEYVLQAIAGGMKVLGFSDHTPHIFPGNYHSRIRMFPEELEDYVQSVLAVKEKYADQIEIHLGLEAEYYPDRMADLLALVRPYSIEYMILGQHWCGNEENEPYNGAPTHSVDQLKRYCDQVIEGMETGLFSYVAHPDLIYYIGDDAIYRKHAKRLCLAAKDLDIPLEINLLGYANGRHYPRELFWQIAGECDCKVVLGSDAHTPTHLINPESEKKARLLVKKYDLKLLEHIPICPCI